MLERVNGDQPIAGLCLVLNKELAIQVTREFIELKAYAGLKMLAVYGGQKITVQAKKLEAKPNIIIGTPGRVMDMNNRGLPRGQGHQDRRARRSRQNALHWLPRGYPEDPGIHEARLLTVFVSAFTISPEIQKLFGST